jgi:hypothetical protein
MNLSPPIPWRDVPTGAVVLLDGVPRTVLVDPGHAGMAGVEGLPLFRPETDTVQLVVLDDADAVATLAAAGLNPEPIEENPSS